MMFLPELHGALSGLVLEDAGEVEVGFKAQVKGNFLEAAVGGYEQVLGLLNAQRQVILGGRDARVFAEHLPEIRIAHVELGGQSFDVDIRIHIFTEIKASLADGAFDGLVGKFLVAHHREDFAQHQNGGGRDELLVA